MQRSDLIVICHNFNRNWISPCLKEAIEKAGLDEKKVKHALPNVISIYADKKDAELYLWTFHRGSVHYKLWPPSNKAYDFPIPDNTIERRFERYFD